MSMQKLNLIIFGIVIALLATTAQSREIHRLPLVPNAVGPESIAFDCAGNGPYVGVSDGRILKWSGPTQGWTEFAVTSPYRPRYCDGLNNSPMEHYCGRPLGLKFDTSTCKLYIADSSFGLMKVGPNGGIATPLARGAAGIPFRFVNALDIDSNARIVYFTHTTSRYHRWEYMLAITRLDHFGRLIKYDIMNKVVMVLFDGLAFPNGVALSEAKDFVLVAETTLNQIRRVWLTGSRAGSSDIFARLTGRPDNVNRNSHGEFWVAQNPTRPVKLDRSGRVIDSLSTLPIVDCNDVVEFRNQIWLGSVTRNYLLYSTQ